MSVELIGLYMCCVTCSVYVDKALVTFVLSYVTLSVF